MCMERYAYVKNCIYIERDVYKSTDLDIYLYNCHLNGSRSNWSVLYFLNKL